MQGLARPRKPMQGPRKNSSASLSCKPSSFSADILVCCITDILVRLGYACTKRSDSSLRSAYIPVCRAADFLERLASSTFVGIFVGISARKEICRLNKENPVLAIQEVKRPVSL